MAGGWAAGFAVGHAAGRQIGDAILGAIQQSKIADIMAAKPEESQGWGNTETAQIQGLTNAKDANGNPAFTVGTSFIGPDGKEVAGGPDLPEGARFKGLTFTPNVKNADGTPLTNPDGTAVANRIDQRGVTDFLGQRYDAGLTPQQLQSARTRAITDVLMPTNPLLAMRAMRENEQADRDAQQFGLNKVLTEQQIAEGKRREEQATRDKQHLDERVAAFGSSSYGQQMADYAKQVQAWDAAGRPAGQEPARPQYTMFHALENAATDLAVGQKYGKVDPGKVIALQEQIRKANDEGYGRALLAAQNGASPQEVARIFNESGAAKVDPSALSISYEGDGKNAPKTAIIKLPDGTTINALSQLQALDKAKGVVDQFYAAKRDKRDDAHLGISAAQARAGIELHNLQAEKIREDNAERGQYRGVRDKLQTAIENGDKEQEAKLRNELMLFTTGMKGGSVQMSQQERTANFYLASGAAKTMAEAVRMAHEKVQPSPQEMYVKLLGNANLMPEIVEKAMTNMYGAKWQDSVRVGVPQAAGPVAVPKDSQQALAEASAAVARGAPKAAVNERLRAAGHPELP